MAWSRDWVYWALRHITRNVDPDVFYDPELDPERDLGTPDREDADLVANAPDLLSALEEELAAAWDPDEDVLERFERIADEFYRETGFLRPGKSEPMECARDPEERQAVWDQWVEDRARARIAKAREIVARARGARS